MVCAYASCFGAAQASTASCSTNSIQGWTRLPKSLAKSKQSKCKKVSKKSREYWLFAKSKESCPLVKTVVKQWIQIIPHADERPCQLNFTSIGKKQLFACLVSGEYSDQASIMMSFLHWMRTYWISELSHIHFAIQRGKVKKKSLTRHPFNMDILAHSITAVMRQTDIDIVSAIHDNKLSLAFIVASRKGVQTYYCKPGEKKEGINDGDWDEWIRYTEYARKLFVGSPYRPEDLADVHIPLQINEQSIKNFFKGAKFSMASKRQRTQ
jgi:hypothetical protein